MHQLLTISFILSVFVHSNVLCQNAEMYTASFVAEWGDNDTASVETFTIVDHHLMGSAVHLYPEPHFRRFSFWFNEDGSMRTFNIQFCDLKNTSLPLETKSGFLPYQIIMHSSNGVVDFRIVNKHGKKQYLHNTPRMDFNGDWVPILGQWEWLSNRACKNRSDQDLKFINYVVGIYDLEVRKAGDNKVVFESDISAPIAFYIEDDRIKEIDAMGSPWNYSVKRSENILRIEDYTEAFSKKPVIGSPSPREKIDIDIHGCAFSGSYGSPRKRGREIFGNVVPYNVVWRTGSASATTLSFNKDLDFDGIIVPKGTYNIFTIPAEDKWTLILNTEENAWGSAYRSEFDFVKIPMRTGDLDKVVDQFTIEIVEKDKKGILQLSWDTTMAEVDFVVR